MTATEPTTEPAMLRHCRVVYSAMLERSRPLQHSDILGANTEVEGETIGDLVYEGALTQLFEELKLGQPYYTSVMAKLKSMDCVRQIKRGGGPQPSVWLLMQSPTREMFETSPDAPVKGMARAATLAQQGQLMRDLHKRITDLESQVTRLNDAIRRLQSAQDQAV